jgi:DNA modification methylase
MKEYLNTILCADCVAATSRFESESIDLVITSPPYDGMRIYHGYKFDFKPLAEQLYRILKQGGVAVWIVGDQVVDSGETGNSFRQALWFQHIGFKIFDTMIYEKNTCSFPASKKGNRYSQTFEYMFVFCKGKPKTANLLCDKPNKCAGETNWGKNTDRTRDGQLVERKNIKPVEAFSPRNNIWRYVPFYEPDEASADMVASEIRRYIVGGGFGQRDKSAYSHPATFPAQLAADHIATWSCKGDVVLDPLCGSGNRLFGRVRTISRQKSGMPIHVPRRGESGGLRRRCKRERLSQGTLLVGYVAREPLMTARSLRAVG